MNDNKDTFIKFRCTEEEKAIIEKAAKLEGRTMSGFMAYYGMRKAAEIIEKAEKK